jgi:predicted nucleotidyltransferase
MRNNTSHTYDVDIADKVVLVVPEFIIEADYLLSKLKDYQNVKLLNNDNGNGGKKEKNATVILEEKNLSLVKDILYDAVGALGIQVYMYGSRARGTAWQFSDIDLALSSNSGKIPCETISKLSRSFETSVLPYKVDIIDLWTVSEGFRKNIENDFVKIPIS